MLGRHSEIGTCQAHIQIALLSPSPYLTFLMWSFPPSCLMPQTANLNLQKPQTTKKPKKKKKPYFSGKIKFLQLSEVIGLGKLLSSPSSPEPPSLLALREYLGIPNKASSPPIPNFPSCTHSSVPSPVCLMAICCPGPWPHFPFPTLQVTSSLKLLLALSWTAILGSQSLMQ